MVQMPLRYKMPTVYNRKNGIVIERNNILKWRINEHIHQHLYTKSKASHFEDERAQKYALRKISNLQDLTKKFFSLQNTERPRHYSTVGAGWAFFFLWKKHLLKKKNYNKTGKRRKEAKRDNQTKVDGRIFLVQRFVAEEINNFGKINKFDSSARKEIWSLVRDN